MSRFFFFNLPSHSTLRFFLKETNLPTQRCKDLAFLMPNLQISICKCVESLQIYSLYIQGASFPQVEISIHFSDCHFYFHTSLTPYPYIFTDREALYVCMV